MIEDRDLADRLSRLAAAVPVRPGQLDPVHAGAVRARRQLRMRWLTPLIALVVLALIGGVLGLGSLNVLNGPISSTTKVGDFELTISSRKARYATGELVDLSASLTYVGQRPLVRIAHAHVTPLGFGFIEPINGFTLSPGWRLSCESSDLQQHVPLVSGFRKSGGAGGDLPGFEPFMSSPDLKLAAGRWHPYAVASFTVGDCGSGERYELRADLAIDVVDAPAATERPSPTPIDLSVIYVVSFNPIAIEIVHRNEVTAAIACGETIGIPAARFDADPPWTVTVREIDGRTLGAVTLDGQLPAGILIRDGTALAGPWPMSYGPELDDPCSLDTAPSPSPSLSPVPTPNAMQISSDRDGDFDFVFTSDKRVYGPGEPIHLEAAITYHGSYPSIVAGHDLSGLITFRLFEKVFGKIDVGGFSFLTCASTTLRRDEPLVVPFQKTGGFHNGEDADELRAWMQDPVLTLPAGTWHFTAGASSPCMGQGAPFQVGGELTIVVSDDASSSPTSP